MKRELTAADAELIAQRTIDADDAALASDPPLLLLDTDLIRRSCTCGTTTAPARHGSKLRRANGAPISICCARRISPGPPTACATGRRSARKCSRCSKRAMKEFDCTVVDVAGTGVARERAALSAATALIAAAGHR